MVCFHSFSLTLVLSLSGNAITTEGAEIIKNCLKAQSINFLNISGLFITHTLIFLSILFLKGNNIGNQGKEALKKAREEWVGLYIEGVD